MMQLEVYFKSEQTEGYNETTINVTWSLTVPPKANIQEGRNLFIPQRMHVLQKVQNLVEWHDRKSGKIPVLEEQEASMEIG